VAQSTLPQEANLRRATVNKGNSNPFHLKKFLQEIPVIGATARKLVHLPVFAGARRRVFPGSASFWENRYRGGGTSGSGSYGHLADFKAEILNEFVRTKEVESVIEFGCGDGAQLELAIYPRYVGVDVTTVSLDKCAARFARDGTKQFYLLEALPRDLGEFDLSLSLDVIYHLVEDSVFDSHMRSLFTRSRRYVVVYASNRDALTNAPHVRHRKFTTWVANNAPEWQADGFVANRFPFDPKRPDETSVADFYFFTRKAG
jgi:SAM-dependent methyltransferase